ncbi:carbon-nitrogen hydrolase family protein [Mameliella sp. AT18]|uniref:carbon-nitrogen hydrolase family protein n=1 Tax=Mameliella sp. AT18 TaxID=3028385 RepID=UPI00237BFAAB|nr:carbon-nitrogen hydrolase family protein [Mameliella sp. AT18]MDD9731544.1 carbon-nitrogen hydrolase family protein [Mameliella sp. AT18]
MAKFKAAVVQASSARAGTRDTVAKVLNLIAECGRAGANVVVFPEALVGGYPVGSLFGVASVGRKTPEGRDEFKRYHGEAINVPGPETEVIGEAAKTAGIYITLGVIERAGATLYCAALFFGPDGNLLGKHRKLMPTAAERLCWGFGDGSTLSTVDTPWGKMGSAICWENYMPLMRMAMYGKGVSIYCTPTADDGERWAASMRHIATEGRCFVLSACQYMTIEDFPDHLQNRLDDTADPVLMRGGSMIVDPLGQVLVGPDYGRETILYADLDSSDIVRARFDFDVVGHYARPDVFSLTVDERPKPPVSRLKG